MYSGSVSDSSVSIYDFSAGCHITGTHTTHGLRLFHFGSGGHIDISLGADSTFTGFDYSSATHFSGTVTGGSVSLYDHSNGQFYNFGI
jgi:hypothetical protein